MKIGKLFKSKKAFSAIVASLILMLLAVAAGVVVYSYVMGWIGGNTPSSTQKGVISFDSISANATSGKIQMYVRNTGTTNLNFASIYVGGTAVANNTALTTTTNGITVQSVAYLEVSYTMTRSTSYDVKVVCSDGTTLSQSVQAT
jgi:hypothetical protein